MARTLRVSCLKCEFFDKKEMWCNYLAETLYWPDDCEYLSEKRYIPKEFEVE